MSTYSFVDDLQPRQVIGQALNGILQKYEELDHCFIAWNFYCLNSGEIFSLSCPFEAGHMDDASAIDDAALSSVLGVPIEAVWAPQEDRDDESYVLQFRNGLAVAEIFAQSYGIGPPGPIICEFTEIDWAVNRLWS